MNLEKTLTAAYSAVQAFFWMSFCASVSFAAVYLQGCGFSNASLGAVMAAGNLLGVLLGTLLSTLIDQSTRVTAAKLIPPLLAAQAASLVLLAVFPGNAVLTAVGYAAYIAFCASVNTLILKLYADFLHRGARIDYGIARGIGSLAYVLLSILLGTLAARTSIRVIPPAGLLLCALQLAAHLIFCRFMPPHRADGGDAEDMRGVSLPRFVKRYRRFCVLLLGTALLFFGHNIFCNFLINVTRHLGGDTGTMGRLNGFMAAVEIPVMLLYTRFMGKRSAGRALRVSFLFFLIKSIALAAAPNIPSLYAALALQAPSFALYAAAIVPYVAGAIPYEDSAKAQSLAYSMTTLGAVLSSVFGGALYDATSVTRTLWIACAICAVGMIVAVSGIEKERNTLQKRG